MLPLCTFYSSVYMETILCYVLLVYEKKFVSATAAFNHTTNKFWWFLKKGIRSKQPCPTSPTFFVDISILDLFNPPLNALISIKVKNENLSDLAIMIEIKFFAIKHSPHTLLYHDIDWSYTYLIYLYFPMTLHFFTFLSSERNISWKSWPVVWVFAVPK